MSQNIPRILKVIAEKGGTLFGTNSGCWFPGGTILPDPPVETELHRLSVQLLNCTCNTWTVKKMVKRGFLEPTGEPNVFKITEKAKVYTDKMGV